MMDHPEYTAKEQDRTAPTSPNAKTPSFRRGP